MKNIMSYNMYEIYNMAFRVTITIIPTIHFHELIRYEFAGSMSVVLAQGLTFRDSLSVS